MNARTGRTPRASDEVELGVLEHSTGFLLRAAHDASAQAFARRAAHLDAGAGEYATLTIIAANPGITQGRLSVATGRHMSTLTPILRRLSAAGWIERAAVPEDRRSFALALTERGARRLRDLAQLAHEHERELDSIVGPQRKAEFVRVLRRIRALMP